MPTYFVVNSPSPTPATAATLAHPRRHGCWVSANVAAIVEGARGGQRLVVLRFAGAGAFPAWYDSPTYQAIIGMRAGSTEGFALLADAREELRGRPRWLTIGATRVG
jgi:hypothetical protein